MTISKKILKSIEKSAWIRKMFEEGARLKSEFGDENVFDFSIGNPDLSPPEKFFSKLKELSSKKKVGVHGYMPNAGFPKVRESIAQKVSKEQKVKVDLNSIMMTCGAAGGLNAIFKTILDPGDQVIVPKPYFVEYGFYIGNHNGEMVLVDTNDDFSLNINNIKNALNDKTKAVLITSPNNPTGKVYSEKSIIELAQLLKEYRNSKIYILADEPYREIVYDDIEVPSILANYSQSITATSYSKSLSIPGERIGFIAVNPLCKDFDILMNGLVLSNRILGFVNAPALMQRIVAELNYENVDIRTYQKRRDLFVKGLSGAGYELIKPDGAFYIFCKSPIDDDIKFVNHLQKFNILTVPGTGFGKPGYFRISFAVSEDVIERSLSKFSEAYKSI